MIIKNAEFTISAVREKQYPNDGLPQVVLVGKSNVGKSSFINTIVNRRKLARTSSEPGKTRLINFYKIKSKVEILNEETTEDANKEENEVANESKKANEFTDKDFYFVDLPGYGFSKMSKAEQVKVGKFIEEYLVKCKNISLVIFLIDIRHEPTADDRLMYKYIISQNIPCMVVCNKADKIAVTKVSQRVSELQESLNPLKDLKFYPFSAERKIYTDAVTSKIQNYIV